MWSPSYSVVAQLQCGGRWLDVVWNGLLNLPKRELYDLIVNLDISAEELPRIESNIYFCCLASFQIGPCLVRGVALKGARLDVSLRLMKCKVTKDHHMYEAERENCCRIRIPGKRPDDAVVVANMPRLHPSKLYWLEVLCQPPSNFQCIMTSAFKAHLFSTMTVSLIKMIVLDRNLPAHSTIEIVVPSQGIDVTKAGIRFDPDSPRSCKVRY